MDWVPWLGGGVPTPEMRNARSILVDASHSPSGVVSCVLGAGFNLDPAPTDSVRIDQPWTDFAQAFGRIPVRSRLAARAANAILDACGQYRDHGLAPLAVRWSERDAPRDRTVRVLSGKAPMEGVARGIDTAGALLAEHRAGVARCESGEVTLRALDG